MSISIGNEFAENLTESEWTPFERGRRNTFRVKLLTDPDSDRPLANSIQRSSTRRVTKDMEARQKGGA